MVASQASLPPTFCTSMVKVAVSTAFKPVIEALLFTSRSGARIVIGWVTPFSPSSGSNQVSTPLITMNLPNVHLAVLTNVVPVAFVASATTVISIKICSPAGTIRPGSIINLRLPSAPGLLKYSGSLLLLKKSCATGVPRPSSQTTVGVPTRVRSAPVALRSS